MWGFLYWVFPVVSGLTWLGMLIAMLVVWTTSGRPHYPSMEPPQSIAYISDVGAQGLKPLFIAGSVVMTVFLDLSLVAERWLRHRGRLARNRTMTEKAFMFLSMLGALVDFREHRVLRASFWIKLFFIIIEVALAIGFGVESKKDNFDTAAVLEWTIAFIFTFYILSIFIDLIPAVRTKERVREETALQMEANDPHTRMHEDEARLHQAQYDSPSYRGDGSRLGQNF
ncbi:hypothetical protein GMDG_06520 [Pseudogymnoascus destructans 20631-21]|uniref:CWH43-like N-terminal domain-containing protein n=1 Tax=Pseudogymnoascus destructans (strain ATCC MYA-4855 / 20631-21) TaxID=658429 RepID=L8FSQ6_PSED2|nr:hypothetical protein GMDG_06520 [Pseudogymnoascus destructans 20631-21]